MHWSMSPRRLWRWHSLSPWSGWPFSSRGFGNRIHRHWRHSDYVWLACRHLHSCSAFVSEAISRVVIEVWEIWKFINSLFFHLLEMLFAGYQVINIKNRISTLIMISCKHGLHWIKQYHTVWFSPRILSIHIHTFSLEFFLFCNIYSNWVWILHPGWTSWRCISTIYIFNILFKSTFSVSCFAIYHQPPISFTQNSNSVWKFHIVLIQVIFTYSHMVRHTVFILLFGHVKALWNHRPLPSCSKRTTFNTNWKPVLPAIFNFCKGSVAVGERVFVYWNTRELFKNWLVLEILW